MGTGSNQKVKKEELVCCVNQMPTEVCVLILRLLLENDLFGYLRLLMTCKNLNSLENDKALEYFLISGVSSDDSGDFMLRIRNLCPEVGYDSVLMSCNIGPNAAKVPIDILVINLSELQIPEGVDPNKVQHLVIRSKPLILNAHAYVNYMERLKTFFSLSQSSNLKSVMLCILEEVDDSILSLLNQLNPKHLYLDQSGLDMNSAHTQRCKLIQALSTNSTGISRPTYLPLGLTDLQIHFYNIIQPGYTCNSMYKSMSTKNYVLSLVNFEFTCDPDCQDQRIYFEFKSPTQLKKLIFKARPHQGKLVLVDLPSKLEYISAYEDSDIVIWTGVDDYLSISAFQEKYGQNIKFDIEK